MPRPGLRSRETSAYDRGNRHAAKLMQILSVASEVYPLIKTGGLADVAGALPAALAARGVEVRTLIPGYPGVMAMLSPEACEPVATLALGAGHGALLAGTAAGLDLLVLDAPHLFGRAGNPYLAADGRDWQDNGQRFAALARAAAAIGRGLIPDYRPDIVHAHDWQAAMAAALLALNGEDGKRPGTIVTIHNLAFQGLFPPTVLSVLGLPAGVMVPDSVEFFGQVGFLKAGLRYADRITTVSPTYAEEILTDDGGMGLGGLLRSRANRLVGILNGIDTAVWNPATDPALAAPYDASDPSGRAANKAALQIALGLGAKPDTLLFGVVSRFTTQKGIDLIADALPLLTSLGCQLAVLGSGDAALEAALLRGAGRYPGQVGVRIGYDEALAHMIQGGVDALLVPSRFEPCGLTQLCALRYGAIPIVSRVGGLADTVIDASPMAVASGAATGLQFAPVTAPAFASSLQRAANLFRRPAIWRAMQRAGMATDVSWSGPAELYADLYQEIEAERCGDARTA